MASKAWRAGKHDQIIVRARAFIIAYPLLRNRSPLAFLPSARARFASKKDAKEIKLILFTDETTTTAFRITRIGVNIEVNIWKRVNRRFHVSRNWNFIRSNAIRWDSCTLYCSIYLLWNFFFFFFSSLASFQRNWKKLVHQNFNDRKSSMFLSVIWTRAKIEIIRRWRKKF